MLSYIVYPVDWTLSLIASVLRVGVGGPGTPKTAPGAPLVLYEFESCPFCRIAREQVSASGVTVHVKPCPKGGKRFRPSVEEHGGKAQFPYLIDPNVAGAPKTMYESADIARYLRQTYGVPQRPILHWTGPINQILSQFAVLARYMSGTIARPAAPPEQPLRFYAAERSPGARLVKEMLCSKELEYLWASRAPNGEALPRLEDHSTGETVTGSLAILTYLRRNYPRSR